MKCGRNRNQILTTPVLFNVRSALLAYPLQSEYFFEFMIQKERKGWNWERNKHSRINKRGRRHFKRPLGKDIFSFLPCPLMSEKNHDFMNVFVLIFPANSHVVLRALRVVYFQSGNIDPFELTWNTRRQMEKQILILASWQKMVMGIWKWSMNCENENHVFFCLELLGPRIIHILSLIHHLPPFV